MECAWELDTPLYELLIPYIAGNFRISFSGKTFIHSAVCVINDH